MMIVPPLPQSRFSCCFHSHFCFCFCCCFCFFFFSCLLCTILCLCHLSLFSCTLHVDCYFFFPNILDGGSDCCCPPNDCCFTHPRSIFIFVFSYPLICCTIYFCHSLFSFASAALVDCYFPHRLDGNLGRLIVLIMHQDGKHRVAVCHDTRMQQCGVIRTQLCGR